MEGHGRHTKIGKTFGVGVIGLGDGIISPNPLNGGAKFPLLRSMREQRKAFESGKLVPPKI
jgi:hypothetical protein